MKSILCFFCTQPIRKSEEINLHHPVYRSKGGKHVEPAHKKCHVEYHSRQNDFRTWGRQGGQISAITRRWAFNLRGVRNNPAFELDRQFYRMLYAH